LSITVFGAVLAFKRRGKHRHGMKNSHRKAITAFNSDERRFLNQFLEKCVRRSYNTLPKRYACAFDDLRHVLNPDGTSMYSVAEIRDWLKLIASSKTGRGTFTEFKKMTEQGRKARKSKAASSNSKKGSWHRDGSGKFIPKAPNTT